MVSFNLLALSAVRLNIVEELRKLYVRNVSCNARF